MLKFALRNLCTRPLRTLLALMGLSVAIIGMVGLFSVAEGIDATVTSTFDRIPGMVVMQPGAPIPLFSRLPAEWEQDIARLPGVHVVNREVWARAHIIESKPIISPPRFLFGTDIKSRLKLNSCVYRNALEAGRFLEPADVGTLNAVVSRTIAEEFKKKLGDPIRIDGHKFKIVGIYHCGSLLLDVAILCDIGEVIRVARMDGRIASSFYVEPDTGADREDLAELVRQTLRGRELKPWRPSEALALESGARENPLTGLARTMYQLFTPGKRTARSNDSNQAKPAGPLDSTLTDPTRVPSASTEMPVEPSGSGEAEEPSEPEELAVEVRTAADWSQEFERISGDLNIFLLIMTGIGVTIAVLSIINTMLMSVTERFIEFGILKANGWSNADVLKLITLESAILGITGGLAGSALGWVGTLAINARFPTRIHLFASPELLLFAVGFSTVLGILGGLYPAIWASRMLPMDAIRRG